MFGSSLIFSFDVEHGSRPSLRRWGNGRGDGRSPWLCVPLLSSTEQRSLMVTAKFLPDPIVPVLGTCEIMTMNRILDSHPGPPSATWFRIFREQDMVNRIIDGHRWTHCMRTFRREVRLSLRASVDWSDPYSVRSPSPWSSEFDSSDSEVQ